MKKSSSTLSLAGGLVAGLAASLCCIGPLVSLGLGLGSFAASAWFAQWRPVFLGVTFVLLGVAWYLTYRRPRADCEAGSCARPPGKAARISLWLGTLVALGAAIYPSLPAANSQINAATVAASDAKLSVLIPSMDCPSCAAGIEAALGRAPGVKQAAVDYDTKAAVLIYDPSVTSHDQLLALIDGSGFPAERSSVK
ncbi:MAG: mercuric transporter MerT family protein [Candidatus Didemnitutus sp.]|nr:mercuric transporter MerT family protein [Candidatus Didemnitutus sp.]